MAESTESKKEKKKKQKHKDKDADAPKLAEAQVQLTNAPPASTATAAAASRDEITSFLAKHAVTIQSSEGTPTAVLSFDQLAIPPGLRAALSEFKEPTPIQACSWPPALEGKDVIGIAETGR